MHVLTHLIVFALYIYYPKCLLPCLCIFPCYVFNFYHFLSSGYTEEMNINLNHLDTAALFYVQLRKNCFGINGDP